MKKRIFVIILAVLLTVSLLPASVFAAQVKCERTFRFEENIAAELKKQNLFKGVSETDFALEKAQVYSGYLQSYGAKVPSVFFGDSFPENYDDPAV